MPAVWLLRPLAALLVALAALLCTLAGYSPCSPCSRRVITTVLAAPLVRLLMAELRRLARAAGLLSLAGTNRRMGLLKAFAAVPG